MVITRQPDCGLPRLSSSRPIQRTIGPQTQCPVLNHRKILPREFEIPWGGKDRPIQILDVDRSGGSATNPASLQLPLDEVSPLWGKTWREIGIDAFANHRTQGISGVLGSTFLHRPIALVAESGEKVDPAMFARPLHTLGGDAYENGCARQHFSALFWSTRKRIWLKPAKTHLSLHWQQSAAQIAQAAKEITSLYPGGSHAAHWAAGDLRLADLHSAQRRADRALALAAGLEIVAESDRSEVVVGEPFTVDAEAHCRKEAGCELGKMELVLPAKATQTVSTADPAKTQGNLPYSSTRRFPH